MLRKLAALHAPACVMLVKQPGDALIPIGTAFLCHNKGYLLTSAHSINLTDKLLIVLATPIDQFNRSTVSGPIQAHSVTVAQYDPTNDVALLKLADATVVVPPNIWGDEDNTPPGSSIGYLGFPYSHVGQHALKVSAGVISAKVISTAGTKQFQFDAMVEAGNSGGPLIDVATGQIIGIVSGRFSPTGTGGGVMIGNHALGTESTISYATTIGYGKQLMKSEGLDV